MKKLIAFVLLLSSVSAMAQTTQDMSREVTTVAQSIADELKSATGADAAFVAAGFLKDNLAGKDLSQSLQFSADEVSVVKLTGKQVKDALTRSISLYPSPNPAFLHVAGMDIKFNKDADADNRIASVSIGGSPLNPSANYRIAMPSSLARGGLGYFTVWSKASIEKNDAPKSLESLLKGKTPNDSAPRWHGSTDPFTA